MRTSALFDANHIQFFETYGVSAGPRGVGPEWTFCGFADKGEGVNFSRYCADVPLWTASIDSVFQEVLIC